MGEKICFDELEHAAAGDETASPVSRRAVLAASSAGLASLTGCLFGQSKSTDDLCGDPSNPLPEDELNVVSGSGPANIGSETHWRHFRSKDPQGTRSLTNGQPPTESVRSAWSTEIERYDNLGTPIVAGGQIYVINDGYRVVAFDVAKGTEQWRSESIDSDEGFGTELIATDDAAIVSDGARVWSISAETGTEQMEYHSASGEGVDDLLLSGESTLLVTELDSDSTHLFAIDVETGEQVWEYKYKIEDGSSEASLIAANSDTAFLSGSVMHAVDLADGTRRWSSKHAPFDASLIPNQLHSRVNSKIEAFAIQDDGLNQAWKFTGEKERTNPLSVGNGYVAATTRPRYPRSDDGRNLYVLDSDSGSAQWCQYTGGTGTPAIGGEAVYVPIGNLIHAFDLSTGDALWRYEVSASSGASIALVDGAVIYSTPTEVGALTTV